MFLKLRDLHGLSIFAYVIIETYTKGDIYNERRR